MKRTLMEWGVRREYNQSRARFYDRAMSKALVYSKASSMSAAPTPEMASLFLDLKDEDMPEDPKEAILYVLISELEGYEEDDSLSEIRDILDMGTAPFFEWNKKFGDAEVTKIKRRWGFEKCSFDALDPLKRFYVERLPVRQYILRAMARPGQPRRLRVRSPGGPSHGAFYAVPIVQVPELPAVERRIPHHELVDGRSLPYLMQGVVRDQVQGERRKD